MPSRLQELQLGLGFKRQTGTGVPATSPTELQTSLGSGDLWSLELNQPNVPFPDFQQEDDAPFFGKGDEWASQIFPTSIAAALEFPFFLTSQNFAMAVAFMGNALSEDSPVGGAHRYIGTPMLPAVDGVNLPALTIAAGIRAGGAGSIIDIANIGMVLAGWTLRIQKGPGLQNTSMILRFVGCGKYAKPSGLTIPTAYAEVRLGAGSSSALKINGVDYLPLARFVDLEYTWNNNVIPGFFPGSGQQNNYDIAGHMRYGVRTQALATTVELESDSSELDDLIAGTEGDTQITVTGPVIASSTHHLADIHLPRTRHRAFAIGDSDGFTVAKMNTTIMKDASLGPAIFTAVTDKAGIGSEA